MLDNLAEVEVIEKRDGLDSLIIKSRAGILTFPVFALLKLKDRSEEGRPSYSEPILIYCDNAVLTDPQYLADCETLDVFLSEHTHGIDTHMIKIDQLKSNDSPLITASYHPLAVVKKAMDYNFLFDVCPGHLGHRRNGTQCGRVKANGYWVDPPSYMKQELDDHFKDRSKNLDLRPSSIFCPECEPIYYFQSMKAMNQ